LELNFVFRFIVSMPLYYGFKIRILSGELPNLNEPIFDTGEKTSIFSVGAQYFSAKWPMKTKSEKPN